MSLFLLTFFSIYGAGHGYVLHKAWPFLSAHPKLTKGVAFFVVCMVAGPVVLRLLDKAGYILLARLMAFTCYTWMGFLFFFVALALCTDLYNTGIRLFGLFCRSVDPAWLWVGKSRFWLLLSGSAVLALWSVNSAYHLRLERIKLGTDKLPSQISALRVVQISDLHLGLILGEGFLNRLLKLVVEANPDVLVCTGDLLDAQSDSLNHLAEQFYELEPPLGKFAVTGNHEFYSGIEQSRLFFQSAGFELLQGERRHVGDGLVIAGVDDPAVYYRRKEKGKTTRREEDLLTVSEPPRFTILLKHRPEVSPNALGRFDLQLSGHTHNGQIFPFTFVTKQFYPLQNGLYRLPEKSMLFVSRGVGTWGPPMRFLSPPHIVLFEIIGSKSE